MKQITAKYHNSIVQVDSISHMPGRVNVHTIDGTRPFSRYFWGAGAAPDDSGTVFVDSLTDIKVEWLPEDDPFEPTDPPMPEPEYDPALEWDYTTSYMRRGE